MNKVILMGRLTKDPDYKATQDGKTVAKFNLAVDRRIGKETDFFGVTTFGKTADFCEKYLKKGTKIVLTGRIQNDSYTNKEGKKVTSTQIIAEELEFAESKGEKTFTDKPEEKKTEWAPADDLDEELPFNF